MNYEVGGALIHFGPSIDWSVIVIILNKGIYVLAASFLCVLCDWESSY
jgi:hypothetical protein